MTMQDIPNREKYNFSDFTENAYQKHLELAKKNYRFIFYDQISDKDRLCLWRHDIDYSPQRGLALAKIESNLKKGVPN